jgi:hypothetical protein
MAETELGYIQDVIYSTKIAISHIAQDHFWARRSPHDPSSIRYHGWAEFLHSSEELLQPSAFV